MAPDYPAASQAAIEAGRKHYVAKRYKLALEQFTRATNSCPCSRGSKRDRCSCKDFEGVASKDESLFTEAMHKCECYVGRIYNKCDKALHIQALDYRAATFEALKELDRARRDAEWMLELAPRLPDGYLRLGKVARLQKKHEFAWKIYNAGIEVCQKNGHEESPKIEQLRKARHPLQVRFVKRDPIFLPLEIIQIIFAYLDLVTLIRCLRVCKLWQEALTGTSNQRLWRSLVFTRSTIRRKPPRIDALRRLLALSGDDVRELIIHDGAQFSLSRAKFLAIINSAKNLERLELWSLPMSLELPIPLKRLSHLVLRGFADLERVPAPCSLFQQFMVNTAENLQDLRLAGFPKSWRGGDKIPIMPQLKYLMLEITERSADHSAIPLLDLLDSSPKLEQLFLDSPQINDRQYRERDPEKAWPTLQYLRIVERRMLRPLSMYDIFSSQTIAGYQAMTRLNGGRGLKAWDISVSGGYGMGDMQGESILPDGFGSKVNEHKDIESFRTTTMWIDTRKAKSLFEPSLLNGKLHTFDIVFPLDGITERVGESSADHLVYYNWLKGAESIRSMGLFSFSFSPLYRHDEDMPLLSFLKSFPNLEVLEIDTDRYEEGHLCMLMKDILRVTRLKSLYQCRLKGAMMDHLQKVADERGVLLVWGERARSWPMKFGS